MCTKIFPFKSFLFEIIENEIKASYDIGNGMPFAFFTFLARPVLVYSKFNA